MQSFGGCLAVDSITTGFRAKLEFSTDAQKKMFFYQGFWKSNKFLYFLQKIYGDNFIKI